jgi:hypothetical protein
MSNSVKSLCYNFFIKKGITMEYYAMITPGQAGDWGQVILIDARIITLCERLQDFDYSEEEIKALRKEYKKKEWDFLKSEFNSVDKTDIEFIQALEGECEDTSSENYYNFRELDSTYKFNSITDIITFTQEYDVQVIGDLT